MLQTIWPFCFIVALLLFLGILSMNTLSSVRAFVTGESYWSKYQKESIVYLTNYATWHKESDYQKFLEYINVPLQDKVARLELQKGRPNHEKVRVALLAGKNDADDIKGMIHLFTLFQNTSLMEPSIRYWTEGDALIAKIVDRAKDLHISIQSGKATSESINVAIADIHALNYQLTPLEAAFSNSLGEASRKVKRLIVTIMLMIAWVLMMIGILLTRRMVIKNVSASEALRISEERWKFALDGARDGVWDWNLRTNKVLVTKQWTSMLGYEDHELEVNYDAWKSRIHPDDLPKVMDAMENYINGNATKYAIEHRLMCKNGTYKWILTRGIIVSSKLDGKPERIVGTHTDIDELKTIEASLRESDTNQRALLEAMVDGVFVAQDYKFIFANPILPAMLGYEFDEFIGLPFEQVVAPESLSIWNRRFLLRTGQGEEPLKHYQVKFLMKGQKESIWLDLHASRVMFRGKVSVLGILRDISKQKKAEDMIWHQANFDSLTGLPNRRMFRDRLEQEIKKSDRSGLTQAILFLDLDHFKEVNDTLGHDIGDRLLQDAAERLKRCIRVTDTVARLGGDEFVMMLSDIDDLNSIERIARDILVSLARPFEIDEETIYISASIGITLYPLDANEFDALLRNADQAMYAAKAEGRNRFSYYTPSMQAAAQSRMRLANDLRHAIARNEFKLMFQPIVDAGTGDIRKAEALLRWHHPVNGIVSPAEFIPVAEETGIIIEIGEWVFRETVKQLLIWRRTLHPEFQISINKSPIQFKSAHDSWVEYMKNRGLAPSSLVVEITEGLLLDAADAVNSQLLAFRDAGIQVAIDDFGTGYSSLSYLKRYDIDYIKIDQSFVKTLYSASDLVICEAIILMAHKLDMKVVAEGVESKDQFELLKGAGCDYMQGYYFSKPIDAAAFEALLISQSNSLTEDSPTPDMA